jgi:hypothetical protein
MYRLVAAEVHDDTCRLGGAVSVLHNFALVMNEARRYWRSGGCHPQRTAGNITGSAMVVMVARVDSRLFAAPARAVTGL